MTDLAQVIAGDVPVRWLIGRVSAVTGDTFTMTYNGGPVYSVGYVDQVVPQVGDVVHVLASDDNGMLCVGTNNAPLVARVPPVAVGTPLIVSAASSGTYSATTGLWTAGITQDVDKTGCWFYAAGAFNAMASSTLARVEVEVTRTAGGPPEFVEHANATGTGTLAIVADAGSSYATAAPPVGVATWVALPLEWGRNLVTGVAKGVGIGGGNQAGAYSGTGRIRLTPL